MSVRKIPLKERSSFGGDEYASQQEDPSEDSEVVVALGAIREKVLSDRSLHDKVRPFAYHAHVTA